MKRLLTVMILCLALTVIFVGCNKVEQQRVKGEVVDTDVIMNKQFGMVVTSVETADDFVVEPEIRKQNDGVTLKAYLDGSTTVTVKDWWGNTASATVVVEGSKITTIDVTPIEGNVANVVLFGARADDEVSDRLAIQKAIDSLKETGGTVYFPAGKYLAEGLVIHNGITLKLQGSVEDVGAGYTEELKARVEAGEFAILATKPGTIPFRNFAADQKASTGASNIGMIGGMIDLGGRVANGENPQVDSEQIGIGVGKLSSTGGIILCCGENILIENVIFKDGYNNHAIQMSGVSNVTIKDCMFAGFMARKNDNGSIQGRETIQIEHGNIGVIGDSTEVNFSYGEYYYSTNVKIQGNYFGRSDTSWYQLIPIGHHTAYGDCSVTGLEITGNVFDNPYLSAMRFPNYSEITIKNNKFISNIQALDQSAMIEIFYDTNTRIYPGKDQSGKKVNVTLAFGDTHGGVHGVWIEENEFEISGDSNKRLIIINGYIYNYGARTVSGVMLKVPGQLYGKSYTGFVKVSNTVSDVTVKNNKINISSTKYHKDYMITLSRISNLEVSNNEITLGNGISFTNSYGSQAGIRVANEINAKESNKLTIETSLFDKYVYLPDGNGGTIKLAASSTVVRKLFIYGVDGLKLDVEMDDSGNAVVKVICEDGKTFDGWTVTSGNYTLSGTVRLTSDITITAKVK